MKYFIKLIGVTLLFVAASIGVKAQSITTTTISSGTNVVLTAPYHILTVQALGTLAQTLNFYDSATTNLFWTNAAYVSRTSYATNVTNVIASTATSTGIAQTNIYTGVWTYSVTNAAATNSLTPIATIILPPNIPVTMSFDDRLSRGLAVTSTNSATISVTYKPVIGQ